MAAMQRLRDWWRAPDRRGNTMVLLLKVVLLELLDQRKLMSNISEGIKGIEDKVDALAAKLATAQADVASLADIAVESSDTLRALAQSVLELRGDAVPADIALTIGRVQDKANAALALADGIVSKVDSVKAGLAAAEDEADDAIAPAPVVTPDPVVPPVETVVVGEGEAEPVSAPPEVAVEPAVEPAVPAEGAGDVIVVGGEVPAVEIAPAPAEGEAPEA